MLASTVFGLFLTLCVLLTLWEKVESSVTITTPVNGVAGTVIGRSNTLVDSVSNNTLTTLSTTLIPGSTLSLTRALRITVYGDFLNQTGANQVIPHFQLSYGGTNLLNDTTSANTFATNATRINYVIYCTVQARNSAASQIGWCRLTFGGNDQSGNVFVPGIDFVGSSTMTVASGSDQNFVVSVINQLNSSNYSTRHISTTVELF
jgi:hypothetical protein